MLNFLRKLRRKNMNGKYLKYAVGEIFLVVIGILIALGINNWNEERKNKEQLLSVFKEIRSDIEGDIPRFTEIFKNGWEDDSLASVLLDQSYQLDTLTDLEKRSLFFTPLQYQPYQYSTFGFDKLQNLGGDIPSEFDFLLRLLNQQYSTIGPIAREQYEEEANYVTEKHNYLALNMPWYSDFRIGVVTPEAEEFFTKNHVYQNWVAQYIRDNNATEHGFTYGYLIASLSTLVVLNDILGNEQSILLEQFLPKYKNDISGIEGFYQNQVDGNRIEIKMIGGYLFFQNQILKELSRDEYQGLFYSKIRFNRDEDNEIESLTIVNMNSNNTALKIE